nr:MAG TPA: tail tape measure [Caudoviricetes sp.]
MSSNVETKTVQMKFDNAQFEQNAKQSLSTLEKLREKLGFKGVDKDINNVEKSINKCDMTPLGKAIDGVKVKFSALEVMAVTTLANITNSAVNAGKKLISAFTIDPIKSGLQEYETQINAVQTILANTQSKGSTLTDVNAALDELNHYADKTIYNFTEMTRNIGTFTAAGVDLDTSVSAIKGIANLAAVSGSNSQQASTAMYQLSQALAAGTVKLQDWNSVVNAGMGGQVFQDSLKETARVHGINIDKMIKEEGSFRETLKDGWLTSKILTETLSKFTGDLSKEQLKAKGYTDEQIKSIVKMGETANDAATKVKTFTQLMDTLKEAAQSGWTQSWEYIIGDFEEAKKFWTSISDTFSDMINKSADARNKVLDQWSKAGGRTMLIDSLKNSFEALMSIIKPVKEALREVFPRKTAKDLLAMTKNLKDFTKSLKLSNENAKNLKATAKGFFSIFGIIKDLISALVSGFKTGEKSSESLLTKILRLTAGLGGLITKFREFLKTSGLFQGFGKIVAQVVRILGNFLGIGIDIISQLFNKTIKVSSIDKNVSKVGDTLENVADEIEKVRGNIQISFQGVGDLLTNFSGIVSKVFQTINKNVGKIIGIGSLIGAFVIIKKTISGFFSIVDVIGKGVTAVLHPIKAVGNILESFNDLIGNVAKTFKKIGRYASIFLIAQSAAALIGSIANVVNSLTSLAKMDTDKMYDASIVLGIVTGEMAAFVAIMSKLDLKGVDAAALPITVLSIALKILSSAIIEMSKIDPLSLWSSIGAMTIVMADLVGLMAATKLVGEASLKSSAMLISLGATLILISKALETVSRIDIGKAWNSVGILTIIMGELVGLMAATNLVGTSSIRSIGMMATLGAVLLMMASSLSIISKIDTAKAWSSIGMLTIIIGELVGLMAATKLLTGSAKKSLAGAAIIVSLGIILKMMASALKTISEIPFDKSWNSITILTVIVGELVGLMAATKLLTGNVLKAATGAALLLSMGVTIAILASVIKKLSEIDPSRSIIAIGILTIVMVELIGLMAATNLLAGSARKALTGSAVILSMGVSLLLIATTISKLASVNTKNAYAALGILTIVMGELIAATKLVAKGSGSIMKASVIIATMAGALTAIGLMIYWIAQLPVGNALAAGTALSMVMSTVGGTFLMIATLGSKMDMKALRKAIVSFGILELLMLGLVGVLYIAAGIEPGSAIENAKSLSLLLVSMSASLVLLGLVGKLGSGAFIGLAALGTLIVGLGALLVGIGALTEAVPEVKRFLEEGIPILNMIGNALGSFFGNIIRGFADAVMNIIPDFGASLSLFMENAQPFFDGMADVKPESMEALKSLAAAILVLTAANLIEGITRWIGGGGSSLINFAQQLPEFGEGLAGFANKTKNIDGKKLKPVVTATEALASMIKVLPKSGGWMQKVFGEQDISKFGKQLQSYGIALMGYSLSVKTLTEDAVKKINTSADVTKSLVKMANEVPKTGGLIQYLLGTNDLSDFGKKLKSYGESLVTYYKSIKDLDGKAVEKIKASASASSELAKMSTQTPLDGGLLQWIIGRNDLSTFGDKLGKYGKCLKSYYDSVSEIPADKMGIISKSAEASKLLVDLSKETPLDGGLLQWIIGRNDLSTFGDQLGKYGKCLKSYYDSISDLTADDINAIKTSATASKALVDMSNNIGTSGSIFECFTGSKEGAWETLNKNLPLYGKALCGFAESFNENELSYTKISTILQAMGPATTDIATAISKLPSDPGVLGNIFGGKTDWDNVEANLPKLGTAMSKFATNVSDITGDKLATMKTVCSSASYLSDLIEAIPDTSAWDKFWGNGKDFEGFCVNLPKMAGAIVGFVKVLSGMDPDLPSSLQAPTIETPDSLSSFLKIENLVPITEDMLKTASDSIGVITQLFDALPDTLADYNLSDFGRKLVDFGSSFKQFANNISDISDGVILRTSSAIKSIADMFGPITNIDYDKITEFKNGLETLGSTGVSGFIKGFKDAKESLKTTGKDMIKWVKEGIESKQGEDSGELTNAGSTSGSKFIKGLEKQHERLNLAGISYVSEVISGVIGKYFDMKYAGSSTGQGFIDGINDKDIEVWNAGYDLGQRALNGCKAAIDSHSPSKEFGKLGKFSVDGYVNAIVDRTPKVESTVMNSFVSVITEAQEAARLAIGNGDFNPVIRPVLDLSDIESRSIAMHNLINQTGSIGMTATIANKAVGSFNVNRAFKNGQNGSTTNNNSSTINNSFTINGATDPNAVADKVQRIIQKQIERKNLQWV